MSENRYREVLTNIWAKSPRAGAKQGESLLGHTSVVVARLSNLYTLFPRLAERIGEPRLWHRAFWACVLHDLGKSAAGFQAQLRPEGKSWGQRHEVLSLAFLEWAFPEDSWNDRAWVAAGIASHHRDFRIIITSYPDPDDPEDDPVASLVKEISNPIIEALAAWMRVDPLFWAQRSGMQGIEVTPSPPEHPVEDFHHHAVARIHRALKSYRQLVRRLDEQPASSPENLSALALRGLVLLADHTASAHVTPTPSPLKEVQETVERLDLGSLENLYTHQREAANCTGHALLVAPTGSGKTEAALLWTARQQEDDGSKGRIFYLLPYQASLNAMHARLSRYFPEAVALQHSRALQALYRSLLEKGYTPEKAEDVARRERSLARLHYHPIRVLTPYQLLRGAFKLRGYEALYTDAAEGLFIFDEVHAYEPKRLGMILGMVEYLQRYLGGKFLVMSATFPQVLRDALGEVLGNTVVLSAGDALYKSFARHTLHLVEGRINDSTILERIAQHARSGESVLVVCNTVRTAAEVYDALRERLGNTNTLVEMLHGRFNARDRFRKEQRLLNRMGTRQRDRTVSPTVLIATQVVEVSLDIDFDTLFSEPAPLEALVQRFGRVNRGRRYATRDVHVLTAPFDGQGIYAENYVTGALRILEAHAGQVIEESQVGSWLDTIYVGAIGEAWSAEVKQSREEFTAACLAQLRAFQSSQELTELFDKMFDGTEVLPHSLQDEYKS
ncbi:MAG TPA: CRISPR-associated helicase Cas3', partial [Methylomirabilota bacterium]|nr:CRISPR-associated helicase Cas3' [Methylomirabilota bacterium]